MQKHHDIRHEFPEMTDKIHLLKTTDAHFRKLYDAYHEVDHEVHRIESGANVSTDEHLNELRMKRVKLKDDIYALLKA